VPTCAPLGSIGNTMYKVEYLILLDSKKSKCKTVKAITNLLQADSDIEIVNNEIFFKEYSTDILIKLGKKDSAQHLFFNISLICKTESDIELFSKLLKAIRTALNLISKTHYVIWDDLSLFYAQKAYPLIFNVENLMRLLITKFMLTNIGIGWEKDRVPTDVQQSINTNNRDINYLQNVDFIQLKNFLFSENYPNHKDSLIKELKNATDFSNLNLDEIKSLLPESNWNRFFQPIVGCEAEYLKKRWDKLYELRCKVAHNKSFNINEFELVRTLHDELKPHLEKAIKSLNKIEVSDEQKENVAENVVINLNESYSMFMLSYRYMEQRLNEVANDIADSTVAFGVVDSANKLLSEGLITKKQHTIIMQINKTRNSILHNADAAPASHEIDYCQQMIYQVNDLLYGYLHKTKKKK